MKVFVFRRVPAGHAGNPSPDDELLIEVGRFEAEAEFVKAVNDGKFDDEVKTHGDLYLIRGGEGTLALAVKRDVTIDFDRVVKRGPRKSKDAVAAGG